MAEFTGERVIPGEVDDDLLNEHMARYAWARQLAAGARVLDAGCGAGYGSAELAREAREVTGIDIAEEAIAYAREHYRLPNLQFEEASCTAIPARESAFDLVVAFEVIEHLKEWSEFLLEARRVLAPQGMFVVSTPNRVYYAEARRERGPNPFHAHEFDLKEFREALLAAFPRVAIYFENHTEAIVFEPERRSQDAVQACMAAEGEAAGAHFFVAVCGRQPAAAPAGFVYIPRPGNALRERERHIELLERDLAQLQAEHRDLVKSFRQQNAELEERNRWAATLNARIEALGREIQDEQARLRETAARYEAKVRELEEDVRAKTEWARQRDADLESAVEHLHAAEHTLEERTEWALRLKSENDELNRQLGLYRASRWVRAGQRLGVGPVVTHAR